MDERGGGGEEEMQACFDGELKAERGESGRVVVEARKDCGGGTGVNIQKGVFERELKPRRK